MRIEAIVRELLATPERISCIFADEQENEFGIVVLYSDGTSYFRVVESTLVQHRVWQRLIEESPEGLVQFDDMLFSPWQVARVDILNTEESEFALVISFCNHSSENEMTYTRESYTNLEPAYHNLIKMLSQIQDLRTNTPFRKTPH